MMKAMAQCTSVGPAVGLDSSSCSSDAKSGGSKQASEQKLNLRFEIPREALEDRLNLSLRAVTDGYDHIVPLRDVVVIEHMVAFQKQALFALIRSIQVRQEDEQVFPYKESEISIYRIEPKGLYPGQRFVLKQKILGIMGSLENRFSSHFADGISKMLPQVIYGRTAEDRKVMAFYVPPIVEKHNGKEAVIDGIHRNYICRSAGSTITAIVLSKVSVPLPYTPISWEDVKLVESKPPIAERYLDLRPEYFRDLTGVGIDG